MSERSSHARFASDLPKDLPEPERVIPLPDQTGPGDDDDEDQPALPIPNAQVQGDDLGEPDAACDAGQGPDLRAIRRALGLLNLDLSDAR